ncbi:MAG: hypothetical protein SV375_12900 [Thermodesulfobacteriota bacterium]|nr:hypothetical protein [Thermodesulfobacteriota bacterium]
MKMVFLSYSGGLEEVVMEALTDLGIEYYTKWRGVLGRGKTSGPHLGTHVWPKTNSFLAVAVEEEVVNDLLNKVRDLKSTIGKEGIKAFILNLEEVV